MRGFVQIPVLALAIIGLVNGVALGQAATPADSGGNSVRDYRVKQILGAKVNIQGNREVGTIDDIVLGDDGVVEYIILNNRGKMVTVPWQAAKFDLQNQAASVNVTQEQFQSIPTYTADQYPNYYSPAYRTQVYRQYGLTPRPIRRFDRQP